MLAMRRLRHGAQTWVFATAGLAAVAVLTAGCGGPAAPAPATANSHRNTASGAAAGASASASQSPAQSAASPWPIVVAVPAARAGQHQTRALPPATSAVFRAEMTDLWAGIVSGRPILAMPAFFPLVAYEQVKAISNPAADWHNRLVAEFRLDVYAAHDLIGTRFREARLVRVVIPEQQAGWIYPGVCSNGIGYWHVANARLVYRIGGRIRSFGISTIISWRGRWYVVHLGGEVRTGSGGMVDQPSSGPGVPGPPGGC